MENNIIRLLVLLIILYAFDFTILANVIAVAAITGEIIVDFKNKMKGNDGK